MKKLFVITLVVISLFSMFACAYADEHPALLHTYSYEEVIEHDYAKLMAEDIDPTGFQTFAFLVHCVGEDVAKEYDLGLSVYDDGTVAVRHMLPEKNGYVYYVRQDYYLWAYSPVDNMIHVVVSPDLIVNVLSEIG